MGSANGNADEQPVHSVTVGTFFIDKYEITYEMWTDVRNWALVHGYVSTDLAVGRNGYNPNGTNNPVTEVKWYDAVKWCNARSEMNGLTPAYYTDAAQTTVYRTGNLDLGADAVKWTANGYRLPTEAEWEFAARGGNQTHGYAYSGSNSGGDVAWYSTNSGYTTHQVGTKNSNELGIYDMSGNVWEWCWDRYGTYSIAAQVDPKGPGSGSTRVMRSSAFGNDTYYCRVAYRGGADAPSFSGSSVGFRCVQE